MKKKTNQKKLMFHRESLAQLVAMRVLTSPRSLRRLAAVLVMVGASLAFALQATPAHAATGCEPTADVPRYNSFSHWAIADGTVRCAGYYEIRLMTTSGTTLKKMSGYYTSTLSVTSTWVACPSGTNVYTYLYEKANVQGNTFTYTATSAPFLCP
jgi:hypothetical protein